MQAQRLRGLTPPAHYNCFIMEFAPSRNRVGCGGRDSTGRPHPAYHLGNGSPRGPGAWVAGRRGSCNGRCTWTSAVHRKGKPLDSVGQNSGHWQNWRCQTILSGRPVQQRNAWYPSGGSVPGDTSLTMQLSTWLCCSHHRGNSNLNDNVRKVVLESPCWTHCH